MNGKKNFPPDNAFAKKKIAYMMSRFPKITETFILNEMVVVESLGAEISVYPLRREKTTVVHQAAIPYVKKANFTPMISFGILVSLIHFLTKRPGIFFQTLWVLLVKNWGSARYLAASFLYFPKVLHMARSMEEEEISHVHAHFASHPAMAAYVIHQFTGIPYSFTAHGSDLHRDQHMLAEKVKHAAFVVAISNYNRELILDVSGNEYAEKVIVLHCGVNLESFSDRRENTPHEQGKAPFLILCIGTLHEVKGQKFLLEACEKLKDEGVNFSCQFIGDGEDEKMLRTFVVDKNLKEHVVFHGRMTQKEISEVLQTADVLVQPSVPTSNGRREGIPIVLMEAMSSGVPVISSKLSGIPELVEDGIAGILTHPGDVDAISNALISLYSNPELRRQFAKAGRERVETDFDLVKNAAELWGEMYERAGKG